MPLFGILLFILSFGLHELGHAYYMKKFGLAIKEISLFGIGGRRLFSFTTKYFGNTPLVARLIPIGAYVRASGFSERRLECLPLPKYGQILGAGVVINFIFGFTLIALSQIIQNGIVTNFTWTLLLLSVGMLVTLRYSFYLVPVIGGLVLFLLLRGITEDPAEFVRSSGSVITASVSIIEHSSSVSEIFRYSGLLSISLGLVNCLPLSPLDGGQITARILEVIFYRKRRVVKTVFTLVTIIPVLILVLLSISGDLFKVIRWLF